MLCYLMLKQETNCMQLLSKMKKSSPKLRLDYVQKLHELVKNYF